MIATTIAFTIFLVIAKKMVKTQIVVKTKTIVFTEKHANTM